MNGNSAVDSDALFFDAERHAEALALLTSACLAKGSPESAFPFADRRCRVLKPGAHDYLLRAEASRLSGHSDYAKKDLEAALEIDPTDALVNFGALTWGSRETSVGAAKRLIADENASAEVLARAVGILLANGARVVHRLRRSGRAFSGWICWDAPGPIETRARGSARTTVRSLVSDAAHFLAAPGLSASNFEIRDANETLRALELVLAGEVVAYVPAPPDPPAVSTATVARTDRDSGASSAPSTVNVIVPVYEDFEATHACLEGLVAHHSTVPRRIVAVDDHSPNAELRAYLDRAAMRGDLELIRNETNLGFAGAVNKAMNYCESGDVLLVNADAWLPPGAIDRLTAVAHGSDDIGTVTPFSNNGELTSYPVPYLANRMPPQERIAEIDALARRANGAGVVDLPNGIGFCLYIKRACLEAVGPLSEAYSRGYYEDVEFCLKARERGFRNVCATGIFVGHAGSLSFGAEKRALVVRNLGVLHLRFPSYRLSCAAFLSGDPLKRARSAIDELMTPDGEVVLLASGQGKSKLLAEARAKDIVAADPSATVLYCMSSLAGERVEIRREGEGAPQSLAYSLEASSGLSALRRYLGRLRVSRLEVFDAPAIPEAVLEAVFALGARVHLICADLEWFGRLPAPYAGACQGQASRDACDPCGAIFIPKSSDSEEWTVQRDRLSLALTHAEAIKPLDRMGDAFSRRIFKAKAVDLDADLAVAGGSRTNRRPYRRARGSVESAVLGVLAPLPSATADRLILRLGRLFARLRLATSIVVLGGCMDDLGLMAAGNIFVTGPAAPAEYERLAEQYGIGPLLLADRTAFFGLLDRLALKRGGPKAYFDWSFGAMETWSGDLSLDPRICDEKAAEAIAFWLGANYRNAVQ